MCKADGRGGRQPTPFPLDNPSAGVKIAVSTESAQAPIKTAPEGISDVMPYSPDLTRNLGRSYESAVALEPAGPDKVVGLHGSGLLSGVGYLIGIIYSAIYVHSVFFTEPLTFDDAYMFIRYAKNIIAGLGHSWNPDGIQVYGSTSLLHVLVVTFLRWLLPFQDATILRIASAGAGFLAVIVLIETCVRVMRTSVLLRKRAIWIGVLFPLLLGQEMFLYHAQTGMDTMLSLLCNAILIFFVVRLVAKQRLVDVICVAIAAYLGYLARPDNGIYSLLFPSLALIFLGDEESRARLFWSFCVGFFVLLGADTAIKMLVFGDVLPLAFYAKRAGFLEGYDGAFFWNPVTYLSLFLTMVLPFVGFLFLLARRESVSLLIVFAAPVTATFLYYFTVVQIMGYEARYYFPALGYFVVSSAFVLDQYLRSQKSGHLRHNLVVRAILFFLLISTQAQVAMGARLYGRVFLKASGIAGFPPYQSGASRPLPTLTFQEANDVMSEIARKLPAGTVMTASEYGLVGSTAPHVTIIDLVALHDPYFAHNGFSADEMFSREPDLVWFPHRHYPAIIKAILENDQFRSRYTYYPGAFYYGIAIRNSGPRREALLNIIGAQWKVTYPGYEMVDYEAKPAQK